jgi:CheY-like chemotaxis protein
MSSCILQVEDCEEDVFFLKFAFEQAGVDAIIKVARDGFEAMDYLSGKGKFADRMQFPMPSLVLMDLKMPQKTGWEVLAWIRQNAELRHLPIIILSGSSQQQDIDRAYDLGANAFLVKSNVEAMVDKAKALKHFWLTHNCFSDGTSRGMRSGNAASVAAIGF